VVVALQQPDVVGAGTDQRDAGVAAQRQQVALVAQQHQRLDRHARASARCSAVSNTSGARAASTKGRSNRPRRNFCSSSRRTDASTSAGSIVAALERRARSGSP
jgi:hypothetical protein